MRLHFFSLIELLVVVSIIALLAGLVFPALKQAMEEARQVECRSKIQQMMQGVEMYQQANDRQLPPMNANNIFFTERLGTFLEVPDSFWLCPSGDPNPPSYPTPIVLHYGVNHYDYDDVDGDGVDNHLDTLASANMREVKEPGSTIYSTDADPTSSPHNIGGAQDGTTDWPLTSLAESRHAGQYNAGLLDGSARTFKGDKPNHKMWAAPRK